MLNNAVFPLANTTQVSALYCFDSALGYIVFYRYHTEHRAVTTVTSAVIGGCVTLTNYVT